MTKELQVLQRQVIQKAASLPRSSTFSNMQSAFDSISKVGAFAAQKIAIQAAQEAGGRDATSAVEAGTKKKLAPNLTAATQAYNNAYNNVESNLIALNTTNLINQDLKNQSRPGVLNSESLAEFGKIASSRIEGALEATNDQNKAQVGVKLQESFLRAMSQMSDNVTAFNDAEKVKSFNLQFDSFLEGVSEGRYARDFGFMHESIKNADQLIKDYKELGLMDDAQEQQARKRLTDAVNIASVKAGYLEAQSIGEGEKYLFELGSNRPEGFNQQQWEDAISEVLSLKSKQDRAVNEQYTLNVSKWNQQILTGETSTLAELEGARSEVTAADYMQLKNALIKSQGAAAKLEQQKAQLLLDSQFDPFSASQSPEKVRNSLYHDAITGAQEQKAERTENPNAPMSLLDKVEVAKGFNFVIPELNDEIKYSLYNGDTNQAFEAALAYSSLASNGDPGVLNHPALEVDKETARMASLIVKNNTMAAIDPERAVELARATVLNNDSNVLQARSDRYQQTFGATGNSAGSKGYKNLQNAFKDTFNLSAEDNPEAFQQFKNVLAQESLFFDTNEDALDMTKRDMVNIWQTSEYASSQNSLMKFAPEKVIPFADQGRWLDNQISLQMAGHQQDIDMIPQLRAEIPNIESKMAELSAKYNDADPEERELLRKEAERLSQDMMLATYTPTRKIEISGLDSIKTSASAEDLFYNSVIPDRQAAALATPGAGLALFAGSKDRRATIDGFKTNWHLKSLPQTGTREDGKLIYGVAVYDRNGYEVFVEDPRNDSGILEIALSGLDEFLPSVAEELNDKTINQIARKEAKQQFNKKLKESTSRVGRFLGSGFTPVLRELYADQEAPDIAKDIKSRGGV